VHDLAKQSTIGEEDSVLSRCMRRRFWPLGRAGVAGPQ